MKQTAVEWLESKIEDQRENGNCDLRQTLHYCNQAKEMEKQQKGYSKEQVEQAYHCGRLYQGREGDTTFEEFIRTI